MTKPYNVYSIPTQTLSKTDKEEKDFEIRANT